MGSSYIPKYLWPPAKSYIHIPTMSHDDILQAAINRYNLRRVLEGVGAPGFYEASCLARASYEDSRFSRAYENERTAEMRKWELQELFARIDMEQQPLLKEQKQMRALGEVTNNPNISGARRRLETVTRTEIVPMLPCKDYELPRRNLFIGGRGDYVEVSRPMEDQQLEALFEEAQMAEERLHEEQLAKEELEEKLEKEQMRGGVASKTQNAKRPNKYEKGTETKIPGTGVKSPNCTVG